MEPTYIKFIYATFPNAEDAQRICKPLIQKKLAACLNIFPGHRSIYMWEGNIQQSTETAVIIKTQETNLLEIQKHIEAHHPFGAPCIAVVDITAGHPGFLDWIRTNT